MSMAEIYRELETIPPMTCGASCIKTSSGKSSLRPPRADMLVGTLFVNMGASTRQRHHSCNHAQRSILGITCSVPLSCTAISIRYQQSLVVKS